MRAGEAPPLGTLALRRAASCGRCNRPLLGVGCAGGAAGEVLPPGALAVRRVARGGRTPRSCDRWSDGRGLLQGVFGWLGAGVMRLERQALVVVGVGLAGGRARVVVMCRSTMRWVASVGVCLAGWVRGGESGDDVLEVGFPVGPAAREGAWGGAGQFGVAEVGTVGQQ